MARHKDQRWNLPEGEPNGSGGTTHSWESITAAILMDIRDELKELNSTLRRYRVQRMADAVVRTDKRLARRISLTRRRQRA